MTPFYFPFQWGATPDVVLAPPADPPIVIPQPIYAFSAAWSKLGADTVAADGGIAWEGAI